MEETQLEIWGLCPKCKNWFRCDDWFDRSVPLPTCSACHLSPHDIEYREAQPAPAQALSAS